MATKPNTVSGLKIRGKRSAKGVPSVAIEVPTKKVVKKGRSSVLLNSLRRADMTGSPFVEIQPEPAVAARKAVAMPWTEVQSPQVTLTITPAYPSAKELVEKLLSRIDSGMSEALMQRNAEADERTRALFRAIMPPLSSAEEEMSARVARARVEILKKHGYLTRDAIAKWSSAAKPDSLIDTWRSRKKVFAVTVPLQSAKEADVYLAFQFRERKPLAIIGQVMELFGAKKTGWTLAHWFVSGNGWIKGGKAPVELLESDPNAVLKAATYEAMEPAA
jgi:hypothetical protein